MGTANKENVMNVKKKEEKKEKRNEVKMFCSML